MLIKSLTSRRHFLKSIAFAAGGLPAWAQSSGGYKGLVSIFLFGGNDANNTIVPMSTQGYAEYNVARKTVAIPQNQLLPVSAGSASYGLHPQLTGIRNLYNSKKAAFVLNCGMLVKPTTKAEIQSGTAVVPKNLYSHSDQTSQWQAANPQGAQGTGWGGRASDILQIHNSGSFPMAISVNGNSLQLTGGVTRPISVSPGSTFGLESLGDPQADQARDGAVQQILTFDTNISLIAAASGTMSIAIQNAQIITQALNNAPPLNTVFPNTSIGQQLLQIAKIIQVRATIGLNRQCFFCGLGGFDNHENLLPDHANLLSQLDAAVSAFYQATVELGVANQVTTITESEFSRTLDGNTTFGTDHAWGGHQLVIGGAVKGGDVYGTFPSLVIKGPDDAGDRGFFIPTISNDQYGATVAKWFGVDDSNLTQVFPNLVNFPTKTIPFMV